VDACPKEAREVEVAGEALAVVVTSAAQALLLEAPESSLAEQKPASPEVRTWLRHDRPTPSPSGFGL